MKTRWKMLLGGYGAVVVIAAALAVLDPQLSFASGVPAETIDTSHWKQTFAEEFDGTTLDRHRWTQGPISDTLSQRTMFANGEHQVYVDPQWLGMPIQPVAVAGGMATITAMPLPDHARDLVRTRAAPGGTPAGFANELAYGSGRIVTRGHFAQLYGYFEIRARMPAGKGLWPAFWLLPADGSWPPEIDVVEVLGHDIGTAYQTIHSGAAPTQGQPNKLTESADGFHRYGTLWTPETVDFYIDGQKTGSVRTPADMHKPMYLIANLAVGGSWPGYPDASTTFPARMDIDYIRAWALPKRPGRP